MSSATNNTENNNTVSAEPSKTSGQYHSVKGTVVETIGNITGATSWKQSGRDEHDAGEVETSAAQAMDYVKGTIDRFTGKKDNVVGAITGDEKVQAQGKVLEEKGKVQQGINKP